MAGLAGVAGPGGAAAPPPPPPPPPHSARARPRPPPPRRPDAADPPPPRRAEAVASDQPPLVIGPLELAQGLDQLGGGGEVPDPEQVLLDLPLILPPSTHLFP